MPKNDLKEKKSKSKKDVSSKTKITKTKLAVKKRSRTVDPDVKRLGVAVPDNMLRVGNKQYIYRFDPKVLNTKVDGKRIGIIGASGSGKTRLLLQILRQIHKEIPAWMIINPSEAGNHAYGPVVENEAIIHDNEDVKEILEDLRAFKERQVKCCKRWSIPGTDPIQYDPDPSAGLIVDDMAEDPKVFNDPIFGWLYRNSRNFKVWFAILVQYIYLINKNYRRQLSHIFLFAMSSNTDIKDAYKEFGSFFTKEGDFKQALLYATQNRGTLVIDVLKQTTKIEEKAFWYRHEKKQPPFKIGSDWFNKHVKKKYDPNWEKKRDEEKRKRIEELEEITAAKQSKKRKKNDEPLEIELVDE